MSLAMSRPAWTDVLGTADIIEDLAAARRAATTRWYRIDEPRRPAGTGLRWKTVLPATTRGDRHGWVSTDGRCDSASTRTPRHRHQHGVRARAVSELADARADGDGRKRASRLIAGRRAVRNDLSRTGDPLHRGARGGHHIASPGSSVPGGEVWRGCWRPTTLPEMLNGRRGQLEIRTRVHQRGARSCRCRRPRARLVVGPRPSLFHPRRVRRGGRPPSAWYGGARWPTSVPPTSTDPATVRRHNT